MDIKSYKYKEIDVIIDAFDLKYDTIDVSYILRNYFINQLRNKHDKGNKEVGLNILTIIRLLKSAINTLPIFLKKSDVIVFSNAERRKLFGNYYYDRVTSIVGEKYNKVIYIENPIIVSHKKPTKDIILSDSLFFFFSFLFSKIYFNKKKIKIDKKFIEFTEKYEISLNCEVILKRFIGQYKFMSFYLKYINKPKKVYEAYPNGYYGYNFAFKKFKIPIIELQHGVIYPLHPSYNCTFSSKKNIYSPDFVFTYGVKDKECLEKLNYVKKENIFVVGSYGLEKSKNENSKIGSYLSKIINESSSVISIIATIKDINDFYDLAKGIERTNKQKNLKILILPRFETKEFEDTMQVKVLNVKQTNIFELYKVTNYLITKSSTAALESLFMKIPTFILEGNNSIFKINYSFLNSLNYFSSINKFNDYIENNTFITPFDSDINKIYQTNVVENFINADFKVEKIINAKK
jgi:hypothetical protein